MTFLKKMENLSVAILTTDTIHHVFFVKKIAEMFKNLRIFIDKKVLQPPFEVSHPYEQLRDKFELDVWFNNSKQDCQLRKYAECIYVDDINSSEAKSELFSYDADINIVFGTRKISKTICDNFIKRLVNLHGGDPQKYRGLDSHLWALYHGDKEGLATTLHEINPVLDDGHIINLMRLDFFNISDLWKIRKENTEKCINLVKDFLINYAEVKTINSFKQDSIGRYYSFMPTALKEVVYSNFSNGKYNEIFR